MRTSTLLVSQGVTTRRCLVKTSLHGPNSLNQARLITFKHVFDFDLTVAC